MSKQSKCDRCSYVQDSNLKYCQECGDDMPFETTEGEKIPELVSKKRVEKRNPLIYIIQIVLAFFIDLFLVLVCYGVYKFMVDPSCEAGLECLFYMFTIGGVSYYLFLKLFRFNLSFGKRIMGVSKKTK